MDKIGKTVMGFVSAYTREGAVIDSSFISQLEDVGRVLQDRIASEEKHFYTQYKPK